MKLKSYYNGARIITRASLDLGRVVFFNMPAPEVIDARERFANKAKGNQKQEDIEEEKPKDQSSNKLQAAMIILSNALYELSRLSDT